MNVQKQPSEAFYKKMCSWKFHKIHRKTPVPEAFFNKVAGLRPATLLKKRFGYRCFPANFVKEINRLKSKGMYVLCLKLSMDV